MRAGWIDDTPVTRVWSGGRRPVEEADPADRLGSNVCGWTLERLLGVGGTAAVYEATALEGERAAVKVLARRGVDEATLRRDAGREARLTRAVPHSGVTRVLGEATCTDGSAAIVMELLHGHTLDERRCVNGGALALHAALPIFDAMLDVAGAAHDAGVIHHDIKPGNVFLTRDGGVKLIDFGLARRKRETHFVGGWFGTPGFVAPEQARGEALRDCDSRADIWSLGATMFVVLSGHSVHPAMNHACEVSLAATRAARSLRTSAPDLPDALIEIVDRALAFEPTARWPSVRAMRAALREVIASLLAPRPSGVQLVADGPGVDAKHFGRLGY